MKEDNRIKVHDQDADSYDQQCFDYEYYAHQALFGMCYEFIKPGERLLDLGIGTGLASLPFAKAGLEIHGLDGSAEMLRVCGSKAFTRDLKQHNLNDPPFPYQDDQFHHVISCGVFHFFGELQPIISEISRIICSKGIFAFTAAYLPGESYVNNSRNPGDYMEMDTQWGVSIFTHSYDYITKLLIENAFTMIKRQRLIIRGGSSDEGDMVFAIYIAKRVTGKAD